MTGQPQGIGSPETGRNTKDNLCGCFGTCSLGLVCHQWPCAIVGADPIADDLTIVCERTNAPPFIVGPRTIRTEWTVGDAHRGKVKKITQVQLHTGMSGVVEFSTIHHQHIRAVRQLPNYLLQHMSFPEVQKSGCVGGTCMAGQSLWQ